MPTRQKTSTHLLLAACLFTSLLSACITPPQPPQGSRTLTVLYTNDEHGWMEGMNEGQGAANLMGIWKENEGYRQDEAFLVLSGGDNWTGPAISTWFEGQSMVEVMNAMGYHASVIGNHEFDFGVETLKMRLAEANFPYLSANLRDRHTGKTPTDLGIKPFEQLEVAGLRVGIIGLTTTATPYTTNPTNIVQFDFIDYTQALRDATNQLRQPGVDLLLVPAHLCVTELTRLATQVSNLNINLLGGGHCNESFAITEGNLAIISGGYHFRSYAFARFTIDPKSRAILDVQAGVRENKDGAADDAVARVINRWRQAADAELNTNIGYLQREIPRRSPEMQALITEAWLAGYPQAEIALTNMGGMRDRLPAGDITLGNIVSMMPFNNTLVELHVTGKELQDILRTASPNPAIGGMHQKSGRWVLNQSGKELDPSTSYSILVNDFMYGGGDGYTKLAKYDPQAYNTGIDWRQPVIDWIEAQKSSPAQPLDQILALLLR